jgi:hypothetical protein
MKPVCPPCRRFMKPSRNGVFVLEQMPGPYDPSMSRPPAPGTAEASRWQPYKLWRADEFRCDGCGHTAVAGFAPHNFAEHYMPGFAETLEKCRASGRLIIVNDC